MSEVAIVISVAAVCAGAASYAAAVLRNCGKFISARIDAICTFALGLAVAGFSNAGLSNLESFVLGIGTLSTLSIAAYLALRIRGEAGHEWSERDERHHLYFRPVTLTLKQTQARPAKLTQPLSPFAADDVTQALRYDDIRKICEREHWGEFVVMEPTSGKYFFAKTSLEAAKIAIKQFGGKPSEVVRVGGASRISGATVQ
jgi:hypothetical protein